MTDRPSARRRRRPLHGAAAASVLVLAVLVAACSGGGDDTAAPEATGTTGETGTAPTVTVAPPDPVALLADAVAAYLDGYRFTSVVTVDGDEAIRAEGRQIGGDAEIRFTSGDGTVEYLIVGTGRWARTGDEWLELDEGAEPTPPLALLARPARISILSVDGDRVVAEAVYDGAAFGLEPGDLPVELVFVGGRLVEARYRQAIDLEGRQVVAEVTTTFTPLEDTTPITAPPAG